MALVAAACGDDDGGSDSAETDTGDGEALAGAAPTCLTVGDIYALIGPESEGVDNWADANAIATEAGGNAGLPDLALEIHGPGEESGTFDTFVEFVIDDIAEERAIEDASTRRDYSSSPNDNVIVEGASAVEGSFGWVGYAFYIENTHVLRAFEVDGGEGCVEPNDTTIASGEYPFSRPLFIYVNTAKASEDPAVAQYVCDYLSDAGLEQVAGAGYVNLTDAAWSETTAAWENSGIACPGEGQRGEVIISGSSTVEPISAAVAENVFNPANPDTAVEVTGPGTGDGFQRFCSGETDISDASRAIKDEEAAACSDADIEFVELVVGIDGIATFTST